LHLFTLSWIGLLDRVGGVGNIVEGETRRRRLVERLATRSKYDQAMTLLDRGLADRPRSLAAVFRFQPGLAFVGPIVVFALAIVFTYASEPPHTPRASYSLLATKLNVLLRLVPTRLNAAMAATAIKAAIKAYSIAVTPLVSLISRDIARPLTPSPFTWRRNVVASIIFC
jgi:hypothetical protein